jgi:pimeloyl-ACP methyl ester carboxylesterase
LSADPRADEPGLPLHVTEEGEGPPVVFLHGFGASSFTWRYHATALRETHRVILVDLKGFGRAPKPRDTAYGPLDHAEIVADLIVTRDLRGVTLVGHSLGGGVALLATLLLRDRGEGGRIHGVIDMAGPSYRQTLPPFVAMARTGWVAEVFLRMVSPRWVIRRALLRVVHDPRSVSDEQVAAYARALEEPDGRRAAREAALRLVPPDLDRWTARYPEIEVPVLLVWGRGDSVIPLWVGERLEGELPGARLVVLEECGHMGPEEKPAETLELIRSFLDRLATPSP